MSHPTTAGRRGLAAAAALTALLTAAACGTQTAADLDGSVPGARPSSTPQGQSQKALDADARRAARGQLPTPTQAPDQAPSGRHLPDARP